MLVSGELDENAVGLLSKVDTTSLRELVFEEFVNCFCDDFWFHDVVDVLLVYVGCGAAGGSFSDSSSFYLI